MKRAYLFGLLLLTCGCAGLSRSSQFSILPLPVDASDNLDGVRVVDSDLTFYVFRDGLDGDVAAKHSRDLVRSYRIIAETIGVEPSEVAWAQVAFTRDPAYQPPRVRNETRWTIPLDNSGALGSKGLRALHHTIPHEQVHSIQESFGPLPRWYSEGMAEWAGLKATAALAPGIETARRAELEQERAAATAPLNLAGWGRMSVKREAILRQLRPEQRRKMETDPNYSPSGPFNFTPNDLVSDESNVGARYAAGLALFDEVEAQAGQEAMRAWIAEVARLPNPKKTEDIVRLAKEVAGVDISPLLADQ